MRLLMELKNRLKVNTINNSNKENKMTNLMTDKSTHWEQSAGNKVGKVASQYLNSTSSAIKSAEGYVKEHPLKGASYAAAAGMVAGSLLTMAFRSSKP
jgi:ElaB/YqjD/DUF883 family membrane-anchored ribosome-binding protein